MKSYLGDYTAFIFDLDGTLINSEKYHADGFQHAVEALSGYRLTASERREFFESHTRLFTPVLAARHGLDLDTEEVLRLKRQHVDRHYRTEVLPGAQAFMDAWRKQMRMALASNSPRLFVKRALVEAAWIDLFESVVTADDVLHRKPAPDMVLATLNRLDLKPEEVMIFEDSPPGVRAAQSAGCDVVMIDNGAARVVEGVPKYTWKDLL